MFPSAPALTSSPVRPAPSKSIIIDAIGAVLGERTSRDLIRTGEKSALVTALFQNLPNLPWFQENGVGPDENGELVISRKIQGMEKTSAGWGACPVPFSS